MTTSEASIAKHEASIAKHEETAVEGLAVGHEVSDKLAPQDEALVRSFQSNLLSLISHELRTPLTGILNALGLLDDTAAFTENESELTGFTRADLVKMARQNAQRLHRTLVTLLDLAAVENRTFAVTLREIELVRMLRMRLEAHASIFRDQELAIIEKDDVQEVSTLGDLSRLSRALDMCIELITFHSKKGSSVKVRISSAPVPLIEFGFELADAGSAAWDQAWSQALTGFESGMASPTSAFAGALQTEQAFLSRTEEGLGSSELLLIHEVMRLHQGSFQQTRKDNSVTISLNFPALSSDDAVAAVLTSRTFELTSSPSAVTLVLIRVPREQSVPDFCSRVKGLLYRVTDGAYPLPERREVALVLDDYKKSDIEKFIARLEHSLSIPLNTKHDIVFAHCPEDVADPRQLVELARAKFI
jgi:hypothetical protein